jgi:zinc finger BED domain-containing protein 1 (E3 SUMO-protein ligase ZBED1)
MDNAPNMSSCGEILEQKKVIEVYIGCMCHCCQLAGKGAEREQGQVHAAIAKAKKVVTYLHHSSLALEKFKGFQGIVKEEGPLPPQAYEIRWNCVANLLEIFVNRRKTLSMLVSWAATEGKKKDAAELDITGEEWSILDGILPALLELRKTTDLLQGSKYVTISRAMSRIDRLRTELEAINRKAGTSGPVAEFVQEMKSQLDDRFYEWTDPEILAMLLDPAIKDTCLKTEEEKKKAWQKLTDAALTLLQPPPSNSSSSSSSKETKMDTSSSSTSTGSTADQDEMMEEISESQLQAMYGPRFGDSSMPYVPFDEVERYKKLSLMDRKFTPLSFWKLRHMEFPTLAKLARKYLAMQASSAAIERVFSTGSNTVTKKRSRLAKDSIEDLIMLHDNKDLCTKLI